MAFKTDPLLKNVITAVSLPSDSTYDTLKRLYLLMGNLGGFFFSVTLTAVYFANGITLPAVFSSTYLFAVALAYAYYFQTKNLKETAFMFSFLLFFELVLTHIALGGFWASGMVFIWAAACAIMAITTQQVKLAIMWIFLFLTTTIALVLLEPTIAEYGPPVSESLSMVLFAMNFGFGLTYMISASFYFMYMLELARQQADNLLLNILPAPIAKRLKEKTGVIADGFSEVTILFADIVNFTPFSKTMTPAELVELLDDLFSRIDALVYTHKLEKIKTTGDAYMVAAGVPVCRNDHAQAIAAFAIELQKTLADFNAETGHNLRFRIGINSGPVVAGVIGKLRFLYDLWGDSVNTASRMESHGIPNEIQVTEETRNLLADKYEFEERGVIDVKGKGPMRTYLLRSLKTGI